MENNPAEQKNEEEEIVARCLDSRELSDFCLVLAARRISCRFLFRNGFYHLMAPVVEADRAREEIRAFRHENQGWPPRLRADDFAVEAGMWFWPLVLVALFYGVSGPWDGNGHLFVRGALNKAFLNGDWWRPVTALFLHSGPVHLLSNLVFGWIFFLLLSRSVGGGAAWFFATIAAVAAGVVNIVIRPDARQIIGFSTAVFAAIGMLCGLALRKPAAGRRLLIVFGSGLGFYAMLGVGNGAGRVDIRSHLYGLGTGILVGVLLAFYKGLPGFVGRRRVQEGAWLFFGSAVAIAWLAALA